MPESLGTLHSRFGLRFRAFDRPGRHLGVEESDDPLPEGLDYLRRADYELQLYVIGRGFK
jgi:hypothetical protein